MRLFRSLPALLLLLVAACAGAPPAPPPPQNLVLAGSLTMLALYGLGISDPLVAANP